MNTQYEKNSIYLACVNYRAMQKRRKLKLEMTLFFTALTAVCVVLAAVIGAVS